MRDMCYFIVLLVIVMMSFGVVRLSILNPDAEPSWVMLREIFHEPYFMIYGEVYAPEILSKLRCFLLFWAYLHPPIEFSCTSIVSIELILDMFSSTNNHNFFSASFNPYLLCCVNEAGSSTMHLLEPFGCRIHHILIPFAIVTYSLYNSHLEFGSESLDFNTRQVVLVEDLYVSALK